MAVNIDTVYQTVLAIANKEQRGYITPLEFNLLASKAQRNIFEQYFYDINKFNRMPGNSTEFSDMLYILEEKIAPFRVNDELLTTSPIYSDEFETSISNWVYSSGNGTATHISPSSSNNYNGGLKIQQSATGAIVFKDVSVANLTAGKKYRISWTVIDMDEPDLYLVSVYNGLSAFEAAAQKNDPSIGKFDFSFVADDTAAYEIRLQVQGGGTTDKYITFGEVKLNLVDDETIGDGGTNEVYRLGDVTWQNYSDSSIKQVPEVTSSQITKYNSSPLAKPTRSNPVYVRTGVNSIKIYPTPSPGLDQIKHSFVKVPSDPYWGYVVVPNSSGGNEYPLYNAASSTNFELHESEEDTLVNKILEYAGVIMKQPDVVQYANGKNNEEFQKENS